MKIHEFVLTLRYFRVKITKYMIKMNASVPFWVLM